MQTETTKDTTQRLKFHKNGKLGNPADFTTEATTYDQSFVSITAYVTRGSGGKNNPVSCAFQLPFATNTTWQSVYS